MFSLSIFIASAFFASPFTGSTSYSVASEKLTASRAPPTKTRDLVLEVFVVDNSERCQAAITYLNGLVRQRPGIRIVVRNVKTDRKSLARLHALLREHGHNKAGVPTFFTCNQLLVGFGDSKTTGPRIENLFTIQVFVRQGCSRCDQGKRFLNELQQRYPALHVVTHDVASDRHARHRMNDLARKHKVPPSVPAVLLGKRLFVGFDVKVGTGRQIEALLQPPADLRPDAPPAPPQSQRTRGHWTAPSAARFTVVGFRVEPQRSNPETPQDDTDIEETPEYENVDELPEEWMQSIEEMPAPADAPNAGDSADAIEVPLFGILRASELGLPVFTFTVGLVDGFNPCAMWVLIFLLSVLVNIKDRKKMVVIAGTFVLVSGLAYFCFMAAWLNLFLLIGLARPVQIALGVVACLIGMISVKDFFAFKKGITLSIPESQKPRIYQRVRKIVSANYLSAALAGAVALAVFVNLIELLCTAGLPALYTEVLTLQQLPPWKNYAYLGLYNVAYMIDDTVMLSIAVATLSHRKLQEREGRWLKLISGIAILLLGIVMIASPDWLHLSG